MAVGSLSRCRVFRTIVSELTDERIQVLNTKISRILLQIALQLLVQITVTMVLALLQCTRIPT